MTVILFAALMSSPGIGAVRGDLEEFFSGVTTLIAPYSPHPSVNVDGTISAGEYDTSVTYTTSDTQISVLLFHDNESLFVGIEGPSWRWVTLGMSSDNGTTMGFVVVARAGAGNAYAVQERLVTSISDEMTLVSPSAGPGAVEEFEAMLSGSNSSAELQLSLEASFWSLGPGVVYPTVVATNLTAPFGFPSEVGGSDVHFLGGYLLRPDDNVKNVNDLFNGKIDPLPTLVAVAIIALGVIVIFAEFVVRRRAQ